MAPRNKIYLYGLEHVDWLDQSKNQCHIYWRRPEEWAALIYEWAVSNGLLNTPCTLYEITQGDDVADECKLFNIVNKLFRLFFS